MGTIALLQPAKDGDVNYSECHLNLWCLPGLFRRTYLLDVGLAFTPSGASPVLELELLLPCCGEGTRPTDLSQTLADTRTSSLVFGAPVDSEAGDFVIHEPGQDKRWHPVFAQAEQDTTLGAANTEVLGRERLSVWRLKLSEPVPAGTKAYVRFRFTLPDPTRTWTWQNSRRAALVDLRFADVRETVPQSSEARGLVEVLARRFLPVTKLNMLVIAPAWLESRASTPQLQYMRLFEGRVWQPYLKRRVGWRRREDLMVYHWRQSDEGQPPQGQVATDVVHVKPFRTFLLLGRDARVFPILYPFLMATLTAGLVWTFLDWQSAWQSIGYGVEHYLQAVTVAAIALFIAWVLPHVGFVRDILGRLPRARDWLERKIYET